VGSKQDAALTVVFWNLHEAGYGPMTRMFEHALAVCVGVQR